MQPDVPLIDIRNATVWRGSTRVFDRLNLEIGQHERVAILGPNGSGKTTLLKLINREVYPVTEQGSWVRVLGRDRSNVWELREQIGVVSDDLQHRYTQTTTALHVVLSGFFSSVGVHGTLATRVRREHVDAARRCLADLGIEALADTALDSMSTGQQRRCLLARALVHRPATLILDEPTAGLDFRASFEYLERLRALAAEGRNIIVVTHHLDEIPRDVHRIVLLNEGRVVADGSKPEVLNGTTLSEVYGIPVRVAEIDGYYLAYPG